MSAKARQDKIFDIFAVIEEWLKDKTKFEAVDILRKFDIPCSPVLSMKELAASPDLRKSGSIVEVDHKERGKYLTIGSPIKFSDLTVEVTPSPVAMSLDAAKLLDIISDAVIVADTAGRIYWKLSEPICLENCSN